MSHPDTGNDVLQFIADGVVSLSGFDVAAISVVEDDHFRIVAVAGSRSAARDLLDRQAPVQLVLEELSRADEWGQLLFVPHDRATGRLHGFQWIPVTDAAPGDVSWHPEDLLCALLRDAQGRLRGLLSVDLPRDGRRPDVDQRQVLNVYADQARRAVVNVVEHRDLTRDLEVERRVSRSRSELMHMLSHEVRSPTTSVLGHAELALDKEPDADVRRHLEAILRGAHRIADMAESMLVTASVEEDRPLPATPIDLVGIAREVRRQLADDQAPEDIELDLPERAVEIRGDTDELGVVVRNLLTNAVKYSPPGGAVRLSVDVEAEHVVLAVRDEGIGISEEDQAHVFEEFFRSPSSEVRARPGHGLGLSIVDRIVRRHGGTVAVASRAGDGTTMSVRLPRARSAESCAPL
ncbi:sensor histidine kinase [Nocardioides hwasunensis]|uniref:histidine kinase n=1 Tax=Nocardioides hwasunensis TaxID=397258 RepID=A0ABR8MKQ8_9ACTN|nr:HAMP domain-containing sensor histidine kinase [Nocardioides hwasunensis]MBD3916518.1 HAMP domain-containing histidine kinase [Nocardioides hwasunensis]